MIQEYVVSLSHKMLLNIWQLKKQRAEEFKTIKGAQDISYNTSKCTIVLLLLLLLLLLC